MPAVSGVISRQVVPACGNLCFLCPSLRTRSRQPVKRYKKLIADNFPRNQEEGPNDRKIGKLCDYAARNPLRIPRTDGSYLFNLESVIPKLCQLAQETGDDERAITSRSTGLKALSAMIVSSVLENYEVPKKNSANPDQEEKGAGNIWDQDVTANGGQISPLLDVKRRNPSWSSTVNDKGEIIVAMEDDLNPSFWSGVCLHNMANLAKEGTTIRRVMESLFRYFDNGNLWSINHGLAFSVLKDMLFLMDDSGTLTFLYDHKVLVSYNLLLNTLALLFSLSFSLHPVAVKNTHVLLSMLIKHLDHKIVLKEPHMQLGIVEVTTSLIQYAKVQPSLSIVGAVSDMMRHLRKCILCSLDESKLAPDVINWNKNFKKAVDQCLVQLSNKVGEAGPILDVMAVMLESISTITTTSRTTVYAVHRTAQIVASLTAVSCQNKARSGYHETRVVAHRIFSVILLPSSVFSGRSVSDPKASSVPQTLSRAVSGFSSSAVLFEKLRLEKRSSSERYSQYNRGNISGYFELVNSNVGFVNKLKPTYSRVSSVNNPPLQLEVKEIAANKANRNSMITAYSSNITILGDINPTLTIACFCHWLEVDVVMVNCTDQLFTCVQGGAALRLSKLQINRLLSSIWAQSMSPDNMPENYEAIAYSYTLVLLVSRAKGYRMFCGLVINGDTEKNSFHEVLVRSFQLAFSLWNISLKEGPLPPSRRRSLFTLATSMIVFASKEYNIDRLVQSAKEVLTGRKVDPYLELIEDYKLQAVSFAPDNLTIKYGSKEDDERALGTLIELLSHIHKTRELFASEIIKSLEMFAKAELSSIREQLLEEFAPDALCELGSQLTVNMAAKDASIVSNIDDDFIFEPFESQVIHNRGLSTEVLDTSHPSGRISVSNAFNMPYKDMADKCEVLLMEKQKMSRLMSTQHGNELKKIDSTSHVDFPKVGNSPFDDNTSLGFYKTSGPLPMLCATEYQNLTHPFKLPASSPYDNFLKAAGC
ncbi:hypothetical protein Fmac_029735 [Flemingia macrophylla]|uniref:ARM repeat superfamily protein n=1 Tax=Flemingia macrophylla TaxID=520843 RepID=A0ABD1LBB3_9FABA